MVITKIPVVVRMCSTHCYPFGDVYKNAPKGVPMVCLQCGLSNLKFAERKSYERTMIFLRIEREIKDTEELVIQFLNEACQKMDTLEDWVRELRSQ